MKIVKFTNAQQKKPLVVTLSFLIFVLMLHVTPTFAQVEYNPGVEADRGISYLVSADPPTGLWWMLIRVVDVSGKEVTLRMSGEFENGTTTENTAVYNVETGTVNGTPSTFGPIIAANLNAGDPLATEPPGSGMTINTTEVRTYLGGSRNVNVLDIATSTGDFTNRWTIVYDQITGIMLEMETESTQTSTQTTVKMSMSVHGTNIFPQPTSSPPTPSSPTPAPIESPTPTPTVAPPTDSPTIGPPTSTPSPTATGTPLPTSTPMATPTPTPQPTASVDYTMYVIIGVIVVVVIATIIFLVRRK